MTEQLQISELFYSIQGESTRAGLPCAFIRLAGCNLRCSYCDSRYTWEEAGTEMDLAGIHAWLDAYPGVMVEITGGEPLLQAPVFSLMQQLVDRGRTVLLETGGSLDIAQVPDQVAVIMDLKCPGSGMAGQNRWQNIETLRQRGIRGARDEVKFVLSSAEDFSWADRVVSEHRLCQLLPVLFSPVTDRLDPAELAALILARQLPVRLQLQLHTRIWPQCKRGV